MVKVCVSVAEAIGEMNRDTVGRGNGEACQNEFVDLPGRRRRDGGRKGGEDEVEDGSEAGGLEGDRAQAGSDSDR